MIVEVVSVGTEILIGQIENTNATHIGRRLAEEGMDCHYQVTVGDNLERLTGVLRTALERSDAVITTGGIGPTQDDLTREAICQVTGRAITRDETHAKWIEERIRASGREPEESVLRMADLPEGAEGLPNENGVALGVAIEHRGKPIFAVPGVPAEMKAMLDNQVMVRLRRIAGGPAILKSRVIRVWGPGESSVATTLNDLFDSANPSLAFLIKDMEVHVRITAKATTHEEADLMIEPLEKEVRDRLGDAAYGVDDETVESRILEGLQGNGWTVGTVELATVGQVGVRLATSIGESGVYRGSVAPTWAGEEPPRPEAEVVLEVGEIGRDIGEGRRTTREVRMAVDTPTGRVERAFQFGGDDERVRSFATIAALHLIRIAVSEPRS